MSNLGFIRAAAVTPKLKLANTEYNAAQIIECLETADKSGCGIAVFPELCITGATCGDLFKQDLLYDKSAEALKRILDASAGVSCALILGLYLEIGHNRVNCAAYIQNGKIKGITPKMFIPASQSGIFSPGSAIAGRIKSVDFMGAEIPFGHILFKDPRSGVTIGIEISDDANHVVTPGSLLSLSGASIIANPYCGVETADGAESVRNAVSGGSAKNLCGYIRAAAGVHESTADAVFCGQSLIAENGKIISESGRFNRDSTVLRGDIDFETISRERLRTQSFSDAAAFYAEPSVFTTVLTEPLKLFDGQSMSLTRTYAMNPFVPDSPPLIAEMCSDIFEIQCAGLAKRLEHTKAAKSVIGVSGGLDSTLALLVCASAHRLLNKDSSDITAVTMPGFGTTGKTYKNALAIMGLLGTCIREIPIKDSVLTHFKDIGHDENVRDVTYENAQARERTQILMDIANKENGIVIGTGDLSEAALGWCTFNGDHMSMYNVNAGVPKTLIQHVLRWIIDCKLGGPIGDRSFSSDNTALSYTLEDVLNTTISPELLPPGEGGKEPQKTEDAVGPYLLNDFFIYHTLKYGTRPEKLFYIAKLAFEGNYSDEKIKENLSVFYRRFYSNQFKRNCMPDGPQAVSVSLSPRGGLSLPSDADFSMWING